MGDQAQDGQEPAQTRLSDAIGMVSKASAPTDLGAAPYVDAEAARPRRLLRDHRQLLQPPGIPGGGTENLETLAVAGTPRQHNDVERLPAHGEAIRSPEGA